MSRCTIALIVLAIAPLLVGAGFDDYPVATIESLLTTTAPKGDEKKMLQKPGNRSFDGVSASKSRVTSLGLTRAIPEERKKYLDEYFVKARKRPEIANLFKEEVLCREGSRQYWLPIQAPVLEFFRAEVSPGAQVDLYLVLVVIYRSKNDELDSVLTINEFQVPGHALVQPNHALHRTRRKRRSGERGR